MKKYLILLLLIITISGCDTKTKNQAESNDIDLYVNILKNHYMLYNDFKNLSIIMNATLKDIESNNELWQIPLIKKNGDFRNFIDYCQNTIYHTQTLSQFADFPGNDPWGEIDIDRNNKMPSYKKLLPSEMFAMSQFSGKTTGKCTSIAHFISSVLRTSGISEDDIFLLRMRSHTIGLFRNENSLYLINNNNIEQVSNLKKTFENTEFYGIYNDKYYSNHNFKFSHNYDNDSTLKEYFEKTNKISFSETSSTKDCDNLIKYAYQSLDVVNIEEYLHYSLKSPHTRELASQIHSWEEIINYISINIKNESIFPDSQNRIMLPDQTLVFKRGNFKDQALLFSSIMKLNNQDTTIYFSIDNAFVELEDIIINFATKELISHINKGENIKFIIKT